jgi:hypothetical protein
VRLTALPFEELTMWLALALLAMLISGLGPCAAQEQVEARGITSSVKLEEVIYGHIRDLNGRFKMRATEVTMAPEAY